MPKLLQRHVIAAYVPAIHQGYLKFFSALPDIDEIYVFGEDILGLEDYLRKDLRALKPRQQAKILKQLGRFKKVSILSQKDLANIDLKNVTIHMPDEDISHILAKRLKIASVKMHPVFLRWDRRAINAEDPVVPDRAISQAAFDKEVMHSAQKESLVSSNIWRRVGAVITKGGKVIAKSSNRHLPTPHSPWIDGDPRGTSKRGSDVGVTTDIHAEAKLIANAAQNGISLKGASIYVTTFPCPPCSKLIAEAGIVKCYYSSGYAMLDGESLLKSYGVELVYVSAPADDTPPEAWIPYAKQ